MQANAHDKKLLGMSIFAYEQRKLISDNQEYGAIAPKEFIYVEHVHFEKILDIANYGTDNGDPQQSASQFVLRWIVLTHKCQHWEKENK